MAFLEDRGVESGRLRWKVRWRVSPTTERSKSFERKSDAQRFLNDLRVKEDAGETYDPNRAKVTVEELAHLWLEQMQPPTVTPATWERYRVSVEVQVLPAFRDVSVGVLRPSAVRTWIAQMGKDGLSASSTIQAVQRLRQILDLAVMDERITKNPAREKGITLPRRPARQRRRYLNDDELIRLAHASPAPEHILTLGYVGMRFGESVGLRIEHLDFHELNMGIYESWTPVKGQMVKGDTKTHQSRVIPMPEPLAEMLEPFVRGRSGLVFTSPTGALINSNNWRRRVFDPAVKAARLGKMTPHDLRHTAVSIAVDSGANVMAVAKMVGHEDARETLRTYADLFPEHLEELNIAIGARMRRALKEQTQLRLVK